MKKTICSLFIIFSFIACQEVGGEPVPTQSGNQNVDTTLNRKDAGFRVLKDKINISSGHISIFVYGEDTLYVVEGRSSSYPVGIAIK